MHTACASFSRRPSIEKEDLCESLHIGKPGIDWGLKAGSPAAKFHQSGYASNQRQLCDPHSTPAGYRGRSRGDFNVSKPRRKYAPLDPALEKNFKNFCRPDQYNTVNGQNVSGNFGGYQAQKSYETATVQPQHWLWPWNMATTVETPILSSTARDKAYVQSRLTRNSMQKKSLTSFETRLYVQNHDNARAMRHFEAVHQKAIFSCPVVARSWEERAAARC